MVGAWRPICARHRDWPSDGDKALWGISQYLRQQFRGLVPPGSPLVTDTVVEGATGIRDRPLLWTLRMGTDPRAEPSGVSVNIKAADSEDCSDRPT
jgi:hypothetical protein